MINFLIIIMIIFFLIAVIFAIVGTNAWRDHNEKISNKCLKCAGIFMLLTSIVIIIIFICQGTQYKESKYTLSEISDGVYALYHKTYSSIPAENYEVVTLCCNGNIYTFTGDISISYTNDKPYVIVQDRIFTHTDDIFVYVPQNTVVYEQSVGLR